MTVDKGKGWYVGDFNGDGKDDLLRHFTSSKGAEVVLSTGNKFESPTKWTNAELIGNQWFVGNFDGDGKADIFRFLHEVGGADMFQSTGSGFQ